MKKNPDLNEVSTDVNKNVAQALLTKQRISRPVSRLKLDRRQPNFGYTLEIP